MKSQNRKERIAYLDGEFVPESEAKVSVLGSGFHLGDGVFDALRTFKGEPYKVKEHVARLFRSLKSVRINPGLDRSETEENIREVVRANKHLLGPDDDYVVYIYITAGICSFFREERLRYKDALVVIHCWPLSVYARMYSKYYKRGVHAVTPSVRQYPPQCMDAKIKTLSRMLRNIAIRESEALEPGAFALLLDLDGNVSEGSGSNFFIVRKENLVTPRPKNILCGISREVTIELAKELDIPVLETDVQMYDVYTADEAFFTTTSWCILPFTKVNGSMIGGGLVGPVTTRLLEAWSKKVGVDIVEQALTIST